MTNLLKEIEEARLAKEVVEERARRDNERVLQEKADMLKRTLYQRTQDAKVAITRMVRSALLAGRWDITGTFGGEDACRAATEELGLVFGGMTYTEEGCNCSYRSTEGCMSHSGSWEIGFLVREEDESR